jgi:uncharacterized protein (TIGR00255 family)
MILSMTGYGRASAQKENLIITCEIKSLNGRASDLRIKSALSLGEKELEIRKLILDDALRGKIDANISFEGDLPTSGGAFNASLIKSFYQQLQPLLDELGVEHTDILSSILRMPNIVQTQNTLNPEISQMVVDAVTGSLKNLKQFRESEGESILSDLLNSLSEIETHLVEINPFDDERMVHLKEKLRTRMEEYQQKDHLDQNRFEQEVLYYLEKLDINEEKVRLHQHCEHFREVMNTSKQEKGKKLAFISQEMGREINTMGAKAQWTPIQKHVVSMKNELEKIKEQLANTL